MAISFHNAGKVSVAPQAGPHSVAGQSVCKVRTSDGYVDCRRTKSLRMLENGRMYFTRDAADETVDQILRELPESTRRQVLNGGFRGELSREVREKLKERLDKAGREVVKDWIKGAARDIAVGSIGGVKGAAAGVTKAGTDMAEAPAKMEKAIKEAQESVKRETVDALTPDKPAAERAPADKAKADKAKTDRTAPAKTEKAAPAKADNTK